MPENNVETLIPVEHVLLNVDGMVYAKAEVKITNLLEQAQNRCPDYFDMYIYNDFHSYGVFDLVDKTITSLNTQIKKKSWKDAMITLQTLLVFADSEAIWTQCDDGSRVRATNKVVGAAALAVFEGLEKSENFDRTAYPSLENTLKLACSLSKEGMVCNMEYGPIFRGIARRLFANKTGAEFTREREMAEEWLRGLKQDEDEDEDEDDEDEDEDEDNYDDERVLRGKKRMEKVLKKRVEEQAADNAEGRRIKTWFHKGDVVTSVPKELKYARAWKEYREYLADCPSLPFKGPPKWDLTTWSVAEKRPFSF